MSVGLSRQRRRFTDRAGRRSFPWQSTRARRAREAKKDQDQVIDIPRFRVWGTGDNRADQADRRELLSSVGIRREAGLDEFKFMICSVQGSLDQVSVYGCPVSP